VPEIVSPAQSRLHRSLGPSGRTRRSYLKHSMRTRGGREKLVALPATAAAPTQLFGTESTAVHGATTYEMISTITLCVRDWKLQCRWSIE